MLSRVQKLQLQNHNGIVLCRGRNASGNKFWLYISTDRNAIEQMQRDYEQGKTVDFTSYGEVIKKGVSDEVPDDIKAYIEENYKFKHE